MNVGGLSNTSTAALASLQPSVPVSAPADADGSVGQAVQSHHHHGGGRMGHAVMEALQSLGVSLPQQGDNSTASSSNGNTDTDGDGDSAAQGSGSIRKDMHDFMHALFQAVRSESSDASSAPGSAAGGSNFASGLSAVVSQVSNGSAPSDLQSAFNQLASDLQSAGATSSGNTGGSASSLTLQNFLSQLQSNLGYADAGAGASTGNIVSEPHRDSRRPVGLSQTGLV
jgi:hypothetical protein